MGKLREVDINEDEDAYCFRPYGALFIKLGDKLAQAAHDALAEHMRRFKLSIYVEDDGLHFGDGLDNEDARIVSRAIIWHQIPEGEVKEQAKAELVVALNAAQAKRASNTGRRGDE
jgi:hypothetical protein